MNHNHKSVGLLVNMLVLIAHRQTMSFPFDTQNCQQSIGTHNLYKARVLNLETIMNANCGCDNFDLPISDLLQDQHLGILGMLCSQGWEHILSR